MGAKIRIIQNDIQKRGFLSQDVEVPSCNACSLAAAGAYVFGFPAFFDEAYVECLLCLVEALGGIYYDDHVIGIPEEGLRSVEGCSAVFDFLGVEGHTEQDIPENCSGESLAAVVWVVHQWLKEQ